MEEFLLSDDVIEQIKNFNYQKLTDDQSLLIDKLILNEELKTRYKSHGLCNGCKQPKAYNSWCQCKFQQNFKNWTSGNDEVDQFIQKAQLKANKDREILEWIEYDRFDNVEYLTKGGFGTIYKAIWKDGCIEEWDSKNNQWKRLKYSDEKNKNFPVVLKSLHNSQNITIILAAHINGIGRIPYPIPPISHPISHLSHPICHNPIPIPNPNPIPIPYPISHPISH
ncbi:kinase-like domain-containing protein [Rhizophagus irregularis DAOM 181602=DAOM 197198]|nr:kinase-like domain-containing protein [Rhizophagus irregularis DAOM 181602=DAOM 197198]